MIEQIRQLITGLYDLLSMNTDCFVVHPVAAKLIYTDGDFLRLKKELALLKAELRTELGKLSELAEEIDGVVAELKNLINRKEKKFKTRKYKRQG